MLIAMLVIFTTSILCCFHVWSWDLNIIQLFVERMVIYYVRFYVIVLLWTEFLTLQSKFYQAKQISYVVIYM